MTADDQRTETTDAPRLGRATWAWIVLGALLLRGVNLACAASASPFFGGLVVDERYYHDWALRLAGGEWVADRPFFLAPLFPYLLGVTYSLCGALPLVWICLQLLLSALTAGMVAVVAARLAGRSAGIAAGVLVAIHGPLVFFTENLLSETLHLALVWTALLLLVRPAGERRWFWGGLASGLATLARNYFLLALVGLALWAALGPRGQRLRCAGRFALGALLALVPSLAHNLAASGEPVLITTSAGANLYLGNHEGANGRMHLPPGLAVERVKDPASMHAALGELVEAELGRPASASEVSAQLRGRALSWAWAHPGAFGQLSASRLRFTLEAREYPAERNYHQAGRWSPLLRWTPGRWPLLLALAAVGLQASHSRHRPRRPRPKSAAPLWIAGGAALAVCLLFWVSDRFRLCLVPVLAVPAGVGVAALVAGGWGMRRRAALLGGVVLTLSLGLSWGQPRETYMSHYNLALQYERLGRHWQAEEELRASIELAPRYLAAHSKLVEVLLALGRTREAQEVSQTVRRLARELGLSVQQAPRKQ